MGTDFLIGPTFVRSNGFKQKEHRFRLHIRKLFYNEGSEKMEQLLEQPDVAESTPAHGRGLE